MLICPRKFKRCWSPRKFANFANICFPPLELTFFWRICRLLCSSIFFCIDFNFLATQYVLDVSQAWKISNLWSIGKLVNCPNNQRQKLSTKPQNPPLYWLGKSWKKVAIGLVIRGFRMMIGVYIAQFWQLFWIGEL